MKVHPLIERFRARGLHVGLDGLQLRCVALARPIDSATLAELQSRKLQLLRLFLERMRNERVGDLPNSRRHWPPAACEAYEERAAIIEFDAGFDIALAEVLAEIGLRMRLAQGGIP